MTITMSWGWFVAYSMILVILGSVLMAATVSQIWPKLGLVQTLPEDGSTPEDDEERAGDPY
jgi:hypothetical protein